MARIICLANSRKHSHRCIAGISSKTGRWIRPVSDLSDGGITWAMRRIENTEPVLLDVIEMPLQKTGPDYACQPENRLLSAGQWRKVDEVEAENVIEYCETGGLLLHNEHDRVSLQDLQRSPIQQRKSLALIRSRRCAFVNTTAITGRSQIRCRFAFARHSYDLVVTDLLVERRVRQGEEVGRDCILTISLGMPWPETSKNPDCYKLVAGVIEL